MSYRPDGRKFLRMTAALALRNVGRRDFAAIVAQALRNVTAGMASATKVLAAAANSNEKSAENWMAGRTLPNALYLKCLEEAFPELNAEIRRVRGLEPDGDIEKEISMIVNTAVRRLANEITARENRGTVSRLSQSTSAASHPQGGAMAVPSRKADTNT